LNAARRRIFQHLDQNFATWRQQCSFVSNQTELSVAVFCILKE